MALDGFEIGRTCSCRGIELAGEGGPTRVVTPLLPLGRALIGQHVGSLCQIDLSKA